MKMSLVVEAALAGMFAAAVVVPAVAADSSMPAAGGADQAQTTPAPATPAKKAPTKVHCFGVNSCKGKSECSVEGKSSCSGKNACKGQGWISLSSRSCKKKHGTTMAPKPAPATPAAAPDAAPASK